MNANALEKLSNRMVKYISKIRNQEDQKRQEAKKLHDESATLKKTMAEAAAAVTRSRTQDQSVDVSVGYIKNRYQDKITQHQKQAEEFHAEAEELARRRSAAESLSSELSKQAGFLRDQETKAQMWADQARQIMAN